MDLASTSENECPRIKESIAGGTDFAASIDHTGHEIDIIIDLGRRLIPLEVKSGSTIAGDFSRLSNTGWDCPGTDKKKAFQRTADKRPISVIGLWFAPGMAVLERLFR